MSEPPKISWSARALPLLAIAFLAVGAHWRAMSASYHLDDFFRATDNPGIEAVAPLSRHFTDPGTMATLPHLIQYRPLLPLTLSLTRAIAAPLGVEPVEAHHLGNLALHIIAAVLVLLLSHALARAASGEGAPPSRWLPFAAAALFAAHPVAGVAVNYVSNRDLLLALVFSLSAMRCYISAAQRGGALAWLGCGLCLILALLSKQNAALFPAVTLAYELTIGRKSLGDPAVWRRTLSLAAIVGAFLALVRYGLDFSDADQLIIERAPLEYPLTELRVHLFYYARNLIYPLYLSPLPAIDPASSALEPGVLAGAAFVAASLFAAFKSARSRPLLAFCVLSYFAWLSMTSSILPMRSFAEDYRQLISLPFACIIMGAALTALPRALRPLSLAAACLWFGALSNVNAQRWESEETLWGRAVTLGTTTQGHLNYGRSVYQRDPALAEEHYERALELNPNNVYAKINLALHWIRTERAEEGITLIEGAAAATPDWAVTQRWLSKALLEAGRRDEAIAPAARAAEIEPQSELYRDELVALLYERASALQRIGEAPASLPLLELLHSKVERRQDSEFQHAWALHASGALEEALDWYQRHLVAEPTSQQARLNLAYALKDLERSAEAAEELRKVLELSPSNADARALLESLGR